MIAKNTQIDTKLRQYYENQLPHESLIALVFADSQQASAIALNSIGCFWILCQSILLAFCGVLFPESTLRIH